MLKNRLNAVGEIDQVRAPILFFHGDKDRIVPIRLGRGFLRRLRIPKNLLLFQVPGTMTLIYVAGKDYFDKLESFMGKRSTRIEIEGILTLRFQIANQMANN